MSGNNAWWNENITTSMRGKSAPGVFVCQLRDSRHGEYHVGE